MENVIHASDLIRHLRADCRHYFGDRPCQPHSRSGKRCTCDEFAPVTRRGVIIKLGAAGDVLRTTPLLRALRSSEPGLKLLWVTHSPELLPLEACEAVRPNAATILRLQQGPWDFCWNLDKDPEACALAATTDTIDTRGYTLRGGEPWPVNEAAWHKFATGIDNPFSQANTLNYVEEIFEMVDVPYHREEYWLRQPSAAAGTAAAKMLPTGHPWIGLNTGAGRRWPTRLWPASHWEELVAALIARGLKPVILGGPEEAELNERLAQTTGALYPGLQNLEVFYALIQRCVCLVSSVTQAMHLAIGARVPLVLFNNIFNAHEFELYGRGGVLQPEVPCDCFYDAVCRTGRDCIKEISVARTLNAILHAIAAPTV